MPSKSLYEWHLTLGHRDINIIKSMEKGKPGAIKDDWGEIMDVLCAMEQRVLGR
jgi:hypothetical protein